MLMITLLVALHVFINENTAYASSGIRIYNYTTKKEYTYTGIQVKVTYNGKKISNDSTPGLIENNIALVPYTDILKGPRSRRNACMTRIRERCPFRSTAIRLR